MKTRNASFIILTLCIFLSSLTNAQITIPGSTPDLPSYKPQYFIELEAIRVIKENDPGSEEELYGTIEVEIGYPKQAGSVSVSRRSMVRKNKVVFNTSRSRPLEVSEGPGVNIDKGITAAVPLDRMEGAYVFGKAQLKEADRRESKDDDLGTKNFRIYLKDIDTKGGTERMTLEHDGTVVQLYFNYKKIN